jgi:two-component system, NarL family, sensor histidine kinase DevS
MTSEPNPLVVPHLKLDDLLSQLQARLQAVLDTRDRVNALLEAVVAVGSEVELESVLRRIVQAAVRLVDARYGALGVIGENGKLAEFIPVGLDEAQITAIDHWPEGKGLLGELVTRPRPLRTPDIAAHPDSSGFPAGHPPMRTFLGAPVQVCGVVYGNLYLTDKRGGEPFDEDDEALVVSLAAAAGAAVDKARLYGEARRQQQWLRASAEVTRRLLSEAPSAEVLALITDLTLELSGADLAVLALPAGLGGHLVIEHASGAGAGQATGLMLPVEASVSGIVMASGEPMFVDDFSGDPRVATVARQFLGLGPAVVFPLGPPGDVRGVLTAGRGPGSRPLSPAAVEMVTTFAAQAGIGLELAEHRRDAERVAVLADRDRIAGQLHDLVIQRLFATGMSLQSATGLLADGPAKARVAQAVDALDETIRDIRASIFTLQSHPAVSPPGVRTQVMMVTDEMTQALGFAPSLRLDGDLDARVPGPVAQDMLLALREALSNAARHARASRVDVTVHAAASLVLTVRDNGAGLAATGRRSGLANLARRAQAHGGKLSLGPAEGGGTSLEWTVPLPPDSEPDPGT